jgi:hypothetical protein
MALLLLPFQAKVHTFWLVSFELVGLDEGDSDGDSL